MERIIKSNAYRKYPNVILITLILIFYFQMTVLATDLSGLSGFRSLVNPTADGYISIGSTSINYLILDDYVAPVAPTSPLDAYTGAKPIVLIIPGLLLLAFIIWFFWLGFRDIKQNQLISGLIYYMISFVLIGFILLIGMPLIMQGANSIIWFK